MRGPPRHQSSQWWLVLLTPAPQASQPGGGMARGCSGAACAHFFEGRLCCGKVLPRPAKLALGGRLGLRSSGLGSPRFCKLLAACVGDIKDSGQDLGPRETSFPLVFACTNAAPFRSSTSIARSSVLIRTPRTSLKQVCQTIGSAVLLSFHARELQRASLPNGPACRGARGR
eukprot:NODE_2686_length_894_cov_212.244338.p2 GENE.NODE_2686_length_894_cov_212.244338~~NODE_2686_length_894_cov_212.244338.p2  ORF type:complete len:172 (-),score=2.80 NODE_2686_length_894_cov_212.244338:56-571(-)